MTGRIGPGGDRVERSRPGAATKRDNPLDRMQKQINELHARVHKLECRAAFERGHTKGAAQAAFDFKKREVPEPAEPGEIWEGSIGGQRNKRWTVHSIGPRGGPQTRRTVTLKIPGDSPGAWRFKMIKVRTLRKNYRPLGWGSDS